MKKIALSSLIALFAVSGANAANVIDGNPLYMPKANHFYSETSVESHTKNETPWVLGEAFGYGVTDRFAVEVGAFLSENNSFDEYAWDELSVAGAFRALDIDGFKLDLVGGYSVGGLYTHPTISGRDAWFDKDNTLYLWTAGVRAGYTTGQFTIAGKALFNYLNTESFNWNEDRGTRGIHMITLGVDGQYVIDSNWNLVAGVEYTGYTDEELRGTPGDKIENAGTWDGTFGINYNIDTTKFVGAYVTGSLNHHGGDNYDTWDWDNGFGFGAKFGIDF